MSARISPPIEVIQGEDPDGNLIPISVYADGKVDVKSIDALQLLISISTTLKKIEYHLALATDTNLNDEDVGG